MSHQLLKIVLGDLRDGCKKLERYNMQLTIYGKLLRQLKKDPKTYKKEIKTTKHKIKFLKKLLRGTKTNLKNSGESMAAIIAYRHRYDLTPKQKKFWNKFNGEIMAKWSMIVPYRTCEKLKNFLIKNPIPR